jgi:hypothetical protein
MRKLEEILMTVRRDALRLGLVASAAALVGRGTARAADALTLNRTGRRLLPNASILARVGAHC